MQNEKNGRQGNLISLGCLGALGQLWVGKQTYSRDANSLLVRETKGFKYDFAATHRYEFDRSFQEIELCSPMFFH